jgi:hypothetical protein
LLAASISPFDPKQSLPFVVTERSVVSLIDYLGRRVASFKLAKVLQAIYFFNTAGLDMFGDLFSSVCWLILNEPSLNKEFCAAIRPLVGAIK